MKVLSDAKPRPGRSLAPRLPPCPGICWDDAFHVAYRLSRCLAGEEPTTGAAGRLLRLRTQARAPKMGGCYKAASPTSFQQPPAYLEELKHTTTRARIWAIQRVWQVPWGNSLPESSSVAVSKEQVSSRIAQNLRTKALEPVLTHVQILALPLLAT